LGHSVEIPHGEQGGHNAGEWNHDQEWTEQDLANAEHWVNNNFEAWNQEQGWNADGEAYEEWNYGQEWNEEEIEEIQDLEEELDDDADGSEASDETFSSLIEEILNKNSANTNGTSRVYSVLDLGLSSTEKSAERDPKEEANLTKSVEVAQIGHAFFVKARCKVTETVTTKAAVLMTKTLTKLSRSREK